MKSSRKRSLQDMGDFRLSKRTDTNAQERLDFLYASQLQFEEEKKKENKLQSKGFSKFRKTDSHDGGDKLEDFEVFQKRNDLSDLATHANALYRFNRISSFPKLSLANENSISLKEIFKESQEIGRFTKAILTTYELDVEWLLDTIPKLKTMQSVILVHGERSLKIIPPPPITLHSPKLPINYGVHHGKLMLLFAENGCRIVISTANLSQIDYDRKNQVEILFWNMVSRFP